jgi:hypothetical protein
MGSLLRKYGRFAIIPLLILVVGHVDTFAQVGDMGLFGGISEGRRLPKTTEEIIKAASGSAQSEPASLVYKEVIFLSGVPYAFEGMLDVSDSGGAAEGVSSGTYTRSFRVYPTASTTEGASIARAVTFNVNYRRQGNQLIEDYTVSSWSESLQAGGGTFTLDPRLSVFEASVITEKNPGVSYYRGDISRRATYSSGGEDGATVMDVYDSFYGYSCAWSGAESHRMDLTVSTPNWQLQANVRPAVSVKKTLQYSPNEPSAISFEGNYKELLQNESGLKYDIYVKPHLFPDQPSSGGVSIPTRNAFEQLPAPDVSFLKGHFAQEDIRKLFSCQILDGDPKYYQPHQAITRGQYVTALAKAVKLPLESQKKTTRRNETPVIVFPDVTSSRKEYPYIMAAYRNRVAIGRDNGNFYVDHPLERQEAVVTMVRTLGLTNLGLDPTPATIFSDDSLIASWAKRDIAAASRLGLITRDDDGRMRPKDFVSKAEAAAMLSSLVEYMRKGLSDDYSEHMVNVG